jgi:putative ABC transport system ATP-binding protein
MLLASGLKFAYDGGEQMSFPDIRCDKGEHWLLLGSSGSGKTTLLHLLAGLRTPVAGEVRIGETELGSMPASQLDVFRGRNIGIVFQQPHFVRSLNVSENLLLTQYLAGVKPNQERISQMLYRLGIQHKEQAQTSELSQGEQQRLALARALINNPAVILADEPTSALDDGNTDAVINLLEEQAERSDATLLVVTHDTRLKSRFEKHIILEAL